MSRRRWLPAGVAGGLAALLALEWLLPGPAMATYNLPAPIAATAPDPQAAAAIGQWGAAILARPLFNASRRPVARAGTAVDDTLPRLSAIIVSGGTRRAIFAAPGQKPLLLAEGGEIGPYRLTAIVANKVELLGPRGAVSLHPQFAATSSTAAAH